MYKLFMHLGLNLAYLLKVIHKITILSLTCINLIGYAWLSKQ